MNVYADTGFVVSLYKKEATSSQAAKTMLRLKCPVWLSHLGELELHNAFHLAVFRGELDDHAAANKKRLFLDDLKHGVFSIQPVPAVTWFATAKDLADKYSSRHGTRSLDLMHIAAAILLKAETFLSFDLRQIKVAKAEGMKVRPS